MWELVYGAFARWVRATGLRAMGRWVRADTNRAAGAGTGTHMSQSDKTQGSTIGCSADETAKGEHAEDRHAEFVRLLGACERALQVYALGMVGNVQDADEVVQETRIKLWKEFPKYDRTKNFASWARAIAYFEVRSFRKRCVRDRLVFCNEAVLDSLAAEYEHLEGELVERHIAFDQCLKRMRHRSHELLLRCYSGNETQKEVAVDLGCSFAGLRQTLLRIRRSLLECVNRGMAREAK